MRPGCRRVEGGLVEAVVAAAAEFGEAIFEVASVTDRRPGMALDFDLGFALCWVISLRAWGPGAGIPTSAVEELLQGFEA